MKIEKQWRFIPPIEASGKLQMSIDSWLFEQYEHGLTTPILRFYTWSKPTISLGYLHKKKFIRPKFNLKIHFRKNFLRFFRNFKNIYLFSTMDCMILI